MVNHLLQVFIVATSRTLYLFPLFTEKISYVHITSHTFDYFRTSASKVPQTQRVCHHLRPSSLDTINTALNQFHKTSSNHRSFKFTDHQPKHTAPERKRPSSSRIHELETQNLQLKGDLKNVRDHLNLSESCNKQAHQEAKVEFELTPNSEKAHTHIAESSDTELQNLKHKLSISLSLVKNMKNKLQDCKESNQAQPLVNETLRQLEAAKRTVELLRADAAKSVHVSKLESSLAHDRNLEMESERLEKNDSTNDIKIEFRSLRSEVELLRSAIEIAEIKFQEEQIQNTVKIRNAYELIEQVKSELSQRETELERKKAEIVELKEKLMDKENELQGIVDENERLNLKLEKSVSLASKNENELKKELKRLDEYVAVLKGEMMDKETTLQNISEENEMLKWEINKRFTFTHDGIMKEEVAAEIGAAKAAERDAIAKLKIMMEEAEKSSSKAARVAEQLEAAQVANTEKEDELKRIKVQCDQWRKAAEAAAAMFSAGNNGKIAERSMSMDNNYNNNVMKNKHLNFYDEIDDWSDLQRKKNGNVLKKIGVLWKKPQKTTG